MTFHDLMKGLFVIYLLYLISKVYFPIKLSIGESSEYLFPIFWLSPLTSITEIYKDSGIYGMIYNFGGNFIMLAPLGFFMCYFYEKHCFNLKVILKLMFFVSVFIECTQVFESLLIPLVSRYFETTDIILNTLGGALGYYTYYYFKIIIYKGKHARSDVKIPIEYRNYKNNK